MRIKSDVRFRVIRKGTLGNSNPSIRLPSRAPVNRLAAMMGLSARVLERLQDIGGKQRRETSGQVHGFGHPTDLLEKGKKGTYGEPRGGGPFPPSARVEARSPKKPTGGDSYIESWDPDKGVA